MVDPDRDPRDFDLADLEYQRLEQVLSPMPWETGCERSERLFGVGLVAIAGAVFLHRHPGSDLYLTTSESGGEILGNLLEAQ